MPYITLSSGVHCGRRNVLLLKSRLKSADDGRWQAPLDSLGKVDRRVSYLRRQLDAALAAAGSQDGAAGTGAHTKAEAVLLGPTAVIRLKSPLAHVSYSSGSKVRPPDQKGKNWPTLSFLCIRTHPTPDSAEDTGGRKRTHRTSQR